MHSLILQSFATKTVAKILEQPNFSIETDNLEDKIKLLIIRDLLKLNWEVAWSNEKIEIKPPASYDKELIKKSMGFKRSEIISNNTVWIEKNIDLAVKNLANGSEVLRSKIKPIVEICETQKQHDLFRILRFYWSSPFSEYVGRRIRLIIRDAALPSKPVIGIAALGSPIIHIPERDNWIGWNKQTRTKNLIYSMDAYVIGALPPYNHLLGGKLISYILASNEVRKIYAKKYFDKTTLIDKRKAQDLACIFTTSLYGRSSQYNRVKFQDQLLYIPIGKTKGYGTLHLSEETIDEMRFFLKSKGIQIDHKFGDGPSWKMRIIRAAGDLLGFDSDLLLRHSFQRNIYAVPLAKNCFSFLNNQEEKIKYHNYPMKKLVEHWKKRWFEKRRNDLRVINDVLSFEKEDFRALLK